jgi:SAM-dependent methyltransferase
MLVRLCIIRESMPHSNVSAAPMLVENLPLLQELHLSNGVLDLACGKGRNGLFLIRNKLPVTFADNNRVAIDYVTAHTGKDSKLAKCWLVDFETNNSKALADKSFDAVLVFNYLHRPLIEEIRQVIRRGGLIFYETFTTEQAKFGRPNNPNFLLTKNELRNFFRDWEILHYFEGEIGKPDRAVARLIARRP